MTKKNSEQERLSKRPQPLPIYAKRSEVQVFMGCKWVRCSVIDSERNSCLVWLNREQRYVRVSDARNIRKP